MGVANPGGGVCIGLTVYGFTFTRSSAFSFAARMAVPSISSAPFWAGM